MRVSRAGLLVLIAISIPLLVEFRTILAYLDVGLSVWQTILLGAAVISALVIWAILPDVRRSGKTNL